jgi:hypothetical protein
VGLGVIKYFYVYKLLFILKNGWRVLGTHQQMGVARINEVARAVPKQYRTSPSRVVFEAARHPKHGSEPRVLKQHAEELQLVGFPSLSPSKKSCCPL